MPPLLPLVFRSLNWLSMGLRYDLVYTTKELSRTLAEPTKHRTKSSTGPHLCNPYQHAKLVYDHVEMISSSLQPHARSLETEGKYLPVSEGYNLPDAMPHQDDIPTTQDFLYDGPAQLLPAKQT